MEYMSSGDLDYLCSQSDGQINMMIAGITTLMADNAEKVAYLENQTWFQRMSNTILGKNRMTVEDIQMNMARINGYMVEALSQLYDRNQVDHQIMVSLGNRINEIYDSQIDMKIVLGKFVNKLNQKIISIDNFHMLVEEINQKVYNSNNSVLSVCHIVSQLDTRTVHDDRKMDIIKRAMYDAGILSKQQIPFQNFLVDLLRVPEDHAGIIILALDAGSQNPSNVIAKDAVLSFFGIPKRKRKLKSAWAFTRNIMEEKHMDLSSEISTEIFFSNMLEELKKVIVQREIQEKNNEYREKFEQLFKYLYETLTFSIGLRKVIKSWELVTDSEKNSTQTRRQLEAMAEYSIRLFEKYTDENDKLINICRTIDRFYRKTVELHPELCPNRIDNTDISMDVKLKNNDYGNGKYCSFAEYIESGLDRIQTYNTDPEWIEAGLLDRMTTCTCYFLYELPSWIKVFETISRNIWIRTGGQSDFKIFEEKYGEAKEDSKEQYKKYSDLLDLIEMFPISASALNIKSYAKKYENGTAFLRFFILRNQEWIVKNFEIDIKSPENIGDYIDIGIDVCCFGDDGDDDYEDYSDDEEEDENDLGHLFDVEYDTIGFIKSGLDYIDIHNWVSYDCYSCEWIDSEKFSHRLRLKKIHEGNALSKVGNITLNLNNARLEEYEFENGDWKGAEKSIGKVTGKINCSFIW